MQDGGQESQHKRGVVAKNDMAALRAHNRGAQIRVQGTGEMKTTYNGVPVPVEGNPIGYAGGELQVPENPIIPFIEGDGTGRDIWKASRRVFDAAVENAYGRKRRVAW